jgi:hypothetical protein
MHSDNKMDSDKMDSDKMDSDSDNIIILKTLNEVNLKSNGENTIINNLLLAFPDGIYQWIFKICFLHPMHILLGFYYEMYLCGIMGIILFGSSLNYWKKPYVKSIARYFDMLCVFIIVPYHLYLSFYTDNKLLYTGLVITGIMMYPLSLYLQFICNYIKHAALCHILLHICVSIGVCFIYRDFYEQNMSKKWNI